MDFVKVPAVYDKLKRAEKDFCPVYISAAAGWGKSAAVKNYYKNKPILVLSGDSGTLSDMPDIASMRRGTVVIEDISWLTDTCSRDYVIKLLTEGSKHVILVGRAAFPQWMSELLMELDFLRIGEKDLQFGKGEIADYMKLKALTLTEEELEEIWKNTRGYPPAVAMYGEHIGAGETIDQQMFTAVCRDVRGYFDRAFFGRWERPVQEMLLALCQYPEFTLSMAELLTGSHDTYRNLCYCDQVGSFLIRKDEQTWAFRERFLTFLRWKQRAFWTDEMYRENYRRAALYYEREGDIHSALAYYQKAEMKEQIKELLIQNAQKHPGKGSYYQVKDYYMALPEDVIKQSPVLMCGMSMLHSMMLQPEQDEKWYQAADAAGNIEMCFAATGILVRCHLMDGQLPTAQELVSSFRAKAEREKATQLMDNLSAFEAWLSLYSGDGSRSEAYLLTAPDEKQQFCTLDRYRVITKIRCLIAKGKLAEALDSALSMDEYFASYGRHYLWMENQILKAIILYRQDDAHWQQVLTEGLKMAEHYHFVRLAALEGSAVQSLLENLKTDEISPEFLKEVRSQAGRMALQYPDYLHYETVETPELTPQEQWICLCYVPGIPKNLGVRVHHDHGK